MNTKIMVGLLAGLPLAVLFLIYLLVRGRALVTFFQSEAGLALPARPAFFLLMAGFIFMAIVFGILASLVYGWLGSPKTFLGLAIGLAVLFSVLAVASRTPLLVDKLLWNFAVGGTLGFLVPFFAGI